MICVSHAAARNLVNILPELEERIVVLPNPVSFVRLRQQATEPLPVWARIAFSKPVVLGVGRLVAGKDFPVLLAATARLIQAGHDVHLVILGEGEERPQLEQLASKLGLNDRFFLPGYVANPYPFFLHAALFATSSIMEGQPTVIIESMALGCPVVASANSGAAELLKDGGGLLVPQGDSAALAEAIADVLSSPARRAQVIGAGSMVAMRHDVSVVAGRFSHLLQNTI